MSGRVGFVLGINAGSWGILAAAVAAIRLQNHLHRRRLRST